jgi:murein DD-endopeptidase MepM/ murein hydrolase activator NlpD
MLLKIKYILIALFLCSFLQIVANGKTQYIKKDKMDTCFPKLMAAQQSLAKIIHKINKKYSDNYLHVLHIYNYNFNTAQTQKQYQRISSIVADLTNAINTAKERNSDYCPNLAAIYTLKGIGLLYQKKYIEAYQTFDTVVTYYRHVPTWTNAYLWLAHTSLYMKNFDTTASLLQMIIMDLDTSSNKEEYLRYETIATDYHILIGDLEQAMHHLLKTEHLPLSREMRTRSYFIIAQIYDEMANYKEAIPYYDIVMERILFSRLMRPYAVVHKHLCEKRIEEQKNSISIERIPIEAIPEDFEPTMVESYHDSLFFNTNYPYYFNDLAAMFFLDESVEYEDSSESEENSDYIDDYYQSHLTGEILESIFENWDSISIHIPVTDFNSMTDTIYLPLLEQDKAYTLPHLNSIVSRFGWRRYRYHYGVDTKNTHGDSIFCIFDGIVRIAKSNKTYGNVVIIRHYNGLETFYAHCSKILVEPNQEVKSGELIALVGNTGRSTGPHLHLETRYKGAAFNPEYMIDFENGKLISDTLRITKETFNYRHSENSSKSSSTTSSVSSSGAVYYRIRLGDTLLSIAKKYKTNINSIKKLNGLRSDFIREGQRIRVL